MLTAFGCLNNVAIRTDLLFRLLVGAKNRPKGIPTPDDHFVDLLIRAEATSDVKRKFALLRQARMWLIELIGQVEIMRYRQRGLRGGRGRKSGTLQPAIKHSVVHIANTAFKRFPELRGKSTRFIVRHVAEKISGYSSLPPKEQKQWRDYVRKILADNQ